MAHNHRSHAYRRRNAGHAGRHVLNCFERTFPTRPLIIANRINANVKATEVINLTRQPPGTVLYLNPGDKDVLFGAHDSKNKFVVPSEFFKCRLDKIEVLRTRMTTDPTNHERPAIRGAPLNLGREL